MRGDPRPLDLERRQGCRSEVVTHEFMIQAGTKLGRYEIRSQLGAGGMGEVYLAYDTKLHRQVAIKFISRDAVNEQANRRLLREARAAATLDHPNICAIHEVAEENGNNFIVMQYVEGETLELRLQRSRLTLKESLRLACQIADAVAEAHERGVVHRDLKPSNIMIDARGRAKVMDFGLAKISHPKVVQSDVETEAILSMPGTILGTVPYMSPEQVQGEMVDRRSDVFSFGVVLYEMLTARRAFDRKSAAAIASAILTEELPPLSQVVSEAPAELERIVRKCVEKNRERRYQTMRDVATDLANCLERDVTPTASQRVESTSRATPVETTRTRAVLTSRAAIVAIAFVVIVIGVVAYWVFSHRSRPVGSAPQIKSIAVLPLRNLSGDASQEYFADGMTEALIANLAQIRALKVISSKSVMTYKGTNRLLPDIAKELNVDAILEGSIQRSGGHVRITAQLIHGQTDAHLWVHEYERQISDVLALENEVARAVADEIRIQITPDERRRLNAARSINPEAHDAYLLGRFHVRKQNEEDLRQAVEYFERATQLAPDYAEGYAALSYALIQRGIFGAKSLRDVESAARIAADTAIKIDGELAEAHAALGNVRVVYDWDWPGAEEEFKRALALDQGSVRTHLHYGHFLMALGRHEEAISEGRNAVEVDPLSAESHSMLGRIFYRARRYDEAIQPLKRAIELEPRSTQHLFRLGDVYTELGRYNEAIAQFEKLREINSRGPADAGIARVFARMGKRHEALEMLKHISTSRVVVASVYAELGMKDQAFATLEKAIDNRDTLLTFIMVDPPLESLHSDPRWHAILRRMKFES